MAKAFHLRLAPVSEQAEPPKKKTILTPEEEKQAALLGAALWRVQEWHFFLFPYHLHEHSSLPGKKDASRKVKGDSRPLISPCKGHHQADLYFSREGICIVLIKSSLHFGQFNQAAKFCSFRMWFLLYYYDYMKSYGCLQFWDSSYSSNTCTMPCILSVQVISCNNTLRTLVRSDWKPADKPTCYQSVSMF